jgi:predicted SAM-dependent methyltransferase
MMFGGHQDQYDYHIVGLDQDFVAMYLTRAGFINVKRVSSFGLFKDASALTFMGIPISLNMTGDKPAI